MKVAANEGHNRNVRILLEMAKLKEEVELMPTNELLERVQLLGAQAASSKTLAQIKKGAERIRHWAAWYDLKKKFDVCNQALCTRLGLKLGFMEAKLEADRYAGKIKSAGCCQVCGAKGGLRGRHLRWFEPGAGRVKATTLIECFLRNGGTLEGAKGLVDQLALRCVDHCQ